MTQSCEKRFAKNEPFEQSEYETQKQAPPPAETFEPYKGKIRKSGTGGIYELNDHLFEGRYSPTNAYGKREVHTVYAKTREECERLLNEDDFQGASGNHGGEKTVKRRTSRAGIILRGFKSLDFSIFCGIVLC